MRLGGVLHLRATTACRRFAPEVLSAAISPTRAAPKPLRTPRTPRAVAPVSCVHLRPLALQPSLVNPPRHRVAVIGSAHAEAMAAPAPGAYEAHLLAATDAVERAGRLCVAVRRSFLGEAGASDAATVTKGDRTPVTLADYATQALIALELGAAFPALPLIAEEDAAALRAPGAAGLLNQVTQLVSRFGSRGPLSTDDVLAAIDSGLADGSSGGQHWVLDPIDGTKGFLDHSGQAQYVIGLALMNGTEAVLGVMGVPNWKHAPLAADGPPGLTIAASAGGGSWWRALSHSEADEAAAAAPAGCRPLPADGWQRCRVDPADAVESATVCISDHEEWEELPMARGFAPRSPRASKRLCCGSLCKYAAIVLGHASAFVQHPVPGFPKLKVWDHAAGVVCVIEAGGAVTDFAGRPLAMAPGREFVPAGLGVLASNGAFHAAALRAIVLGSGGGGLLSLTPSPLPAPAGRLLALLDRDGVLNEDLGTWCMRVEDLSLIPGSSAAVADLCSAGHAVAVVTNQSCVGRGLLSLGGLADIHAKLREGLAVDGGRIDCLLFSEDAPGGPPSEFRKPAPGMLIEAMDKLGFAGRPESAVMVGDTVSDMKAAAAVGVRRIMVCTGHGAKVGQKAASLGWMLPRTLSEADIHALGGLIPEEVHPLELHADLRSAAAAILAYRPAAGCSRWL